MQSKTKIRVLAEEHIEYLSDGAGTRDMSNIGVHFQSATNSDGEMDSQNFGGTRTKKNKRTTGAMRRSTRVVMGETRGRSSQVS